MYSKDISKFKLNDKITVIGILEFKSDQEGKKADDDVD
jgi:hypothetical protein